MALVLFAHGVMAWVFLHVAASGDSKPDSPAWPPIRLVAVIASAHPPAALQAPPPGGRAGVTARTAASSATAPRRVPSPSGRSARPLETFLSPAELDLPARPRSAPDTTLLEGLHWSGLPMRLRLFVDGAGTVVEVAVLQSADADEVVERVRQMFLSTGFIAARANGLDVPSYKDVEIAVAGVRSAAIESPAGASAIP